MSFARDVLCERALAPARACGQCASCLLWAAGNHPDLRVIVPDSLAERRPGGTEDDGADAQPGAEATGGAKEKPSREIRIAQVRALASLTDITAHRGGARVIVLGPAEALNDESANFLLKGLEEPPPELLYVLVSDQIDRCLPTIISRCALVRVAVPPRELALAWLREQGLGEEAAQRLNEAGGAPLAALAGSPEALEPALRATLLGLLRRGAALEAADVAADLPRSFGLAPAVALFQRWGWDYFSYRLGGPLRYHPQDAPSFEALSQCWSLGAAGAWVERLCGLKRVSEHPLNARTAAEGVLLDYIASIAEGVTNNRA